MSDLPPTRSDWQPTPATRELLAAMRRRTTEHLQTVLARVFARADDWLFDLAKKDGAPDGSPYLHAMRSLRTSRAPIERGFREHIDQGFAALFAFVVVAEELPCRECDKQHEQNTHPAALEEGTFRAWAVLHG